MLSLATLFGGHVLNRRLDRIVLIGALLVVPLLAFIGSPYALFYSGESDFSFVTWALRLPPILVGALALLSAGLTFRDARQPGREPLSISMKVAGAVLSSVGVLLVTAVVVSSGTRYTLAQATETASEDVPQSTVYRPFHGYVSFGGGAVTLDLPAPPSGSERLRGRITLDGSGAEGVGLSLILNSQYKVEHLISDSRGVFEVQLPAGTWHINSVHVSEWNGRPGDRDLILFSGREPMKSTGLYTRSSFFLGDGLEVSLPFTEDGVPIELELRDALPMTWPPRSDSFHANRASVPAADFPTAAIAWQPVEAASEYEVQITHVTHEGTTTTFSPILMRRLPGLTLPLASLPQRSVSSASEDVYSVRIYAFDANGKLLTESSSDLDDHMFKLAAGTRLGKEQQSSFGRPNPEVISEEYETNDLRLSLAAKLLDQKQLDAARSLLDQVTDDAPRGRASVLRGRLAALQGDCVTARKMFDKADAEGGAGCVSIEDRNLCRDRTQMPKL